MIEPALSDDALLEDIASANQPGQGLRIWWLGQSGFLLQWNQRHLLFDPYLSESLTTKYAQTDKPHVRLTRRAVDPARLTMVDVVTSSHNHTDHLDAETLRPLMEANPEMAIVTPAANRTFAAKRIGCSESRLQPIDAGQSIQAGPFQLHAVPAAHETIEKDAQGQCRFLGLVAELGPWTVYHSGDTVRYEGMEELLRRWSIDIAMLPINGSLPERRVSGNLWGREAAELAQQVGVGLTIPCHFEMFAFNTVTTDEFQTTAEALQIDYRLMRCGERLDLPAKANKKQAP